MIRVSLRQAHTNEVLDFFDSRNEADARLALASRLMNGTWPLSVGDTITVEEME
jgi:hypothetical protein